MKDECPAWKGWVVLIAGILYLLQDYGFGLAWWRVNWWTAAFVLWGLCSVMAKR
ncbi:hypothetical protein HYS48_00595 [Candidatus Woesearchaeota archaeon]|nr:hypothetical protein [Candidatus Woesearchaeota archaeon]